MSSAAQMKEVEIANLICLLDSRQQLQLLFRAACKHPGVLQDLEVAVSQDGKRTLLSLHTRAKDGALSEGNTLQVTHPTMGIAFSAENQRFDTTPRFITASSADPRVEPTTMASVDQSVETLSGARSFSKDITAIVLEIYKTERSESLVRRVRGQIFHVEEVATWQDASFDTMRRGLHFLCQIGDIMCHYHDNPYAEVARKSLLRKNTLDLAVRKIVLDLRQRSLIPAFMTEPETTTVMRSLLILERMCDGEKLFPFVSGAINMLQEGTQHEALPAVQVRIPARSPTKQLIHTSSKSPRFAGTKEKVQNEIIDLEVSEPQYSFEACAKTAINALSHHENHSPRWRDDMSIQAQTHIDRCCDHIRAQCQINTDLKAKRHAFKALKEVSEVLAEDRPIACQVRDGECCKAVVEKTSNHLLSVLTDDDIIRMRSTWEPRIRSLRDGQKADFLQRQHWQRIMTVLEIKLD